MIKRKAISKNTRKIVYNKFNCHCAYCGCELKYEEMQVDHFIPFKNIERGKNSIDEIETESNYYPACRMCNYQKKSKSIATFRASIKKKLATLKKSFVYRLLVKYKLIKELPHNIVFYFEEVGKDVKE